MRKEVQALIETYIEEIEKDQYVNVIAEAAKIGFDYVVDLRNTLKVAGINKIFDEQFAKMLTTYQEMAKLVK